LIDTNELRQGSIVRATIPDRRGNPKNRPLVIITATDEIIFDEPIVGLAITTTFPDPPGKYDIPIPWSSHGPSQT
jgi:hypothetical protein